MIKDCLEYLLTALFLMNKAEATLVKIMLAITPIITANNGAGIILNFFANGSCKRISTAREIMVIKIAPLVMC